MARPINHQPGKQQAPRPARKTPQRRKGPDEWRAINRSHRVKDGRSVILAVPDPMHAGKLKTVEAYWHIRDERWWLANTAPSTSGCDPLADLYGAPLAWMPMPEITDLSFITDDIRPASGTHGNPARKPGSGRRKSITREMENA